MAAYTCDIEDEGPDDDGGEEAHIHVARIDSVIVLDSYRKKTAQRLNIGA